MNTCARNYELEMLLHDASQVQAYRKWKLLKLLKVEKECVWYKRLM